MFLHYGHEKAKEYIVRNDQVCLHVTETPNMELKQDRSLFPIQMEGVEMQAVYDVMSAPKSSGTLDPISLHGFHPGGPRQLQRYYIFRHKEQEEGKDLKGVPLR